MSIRRKRHLTSNDIAKLHSDDTRKQLELQSMKVRAQKEENPERALVAKPRTSKVDEKYLLKDNTENVIRAKLDRIGYNSRVTPEELAQKKVLSRPEQAEIDANNLRLRELGKEANANIAAEIPPTLDLPRTEEEWTDLGADQYDIADLYNERARLEQLIERTNEEIQKLAASPVKTRKKGSK